MKSLLPPSWCAGRALPTAVATLLPPLAAVLAVTLVIAAPVAIAQQVALVTSQPVPLERAGYRGEARNPFAPTARILNGGGGSSADIGFTPAEGKFKFPRMKLRGTVSSQGELVALLDITGEGIHVVREGDTIGLYAANKVQVIRVRRINRLNIEVEGGSLKQVIIVR